MARQDWKPGNMLYPLPAVMISCKRPNDKPNIITVAWVGTINSNPPMVSVSIKPERYSHDIIEETREFVINLTTEELAKATDYCGVKSGADCDKFEDLHLNPQKSSKVEAPRIREAPVAIECVVTQIERLGSHDMFIAKVVNVSVDEKYMDSKGKFDLNSCGLLAYSHGEYFTLGNKIGKFGYAIRSKKANRKLRRKQEASNRDKDKRGEGGRTTGNRYTDGKNENDAKPKEIVQGTRKVNRTKGRRPQPNTIRPNNKNNSNDRNNSNRRTSSGKNSSRNNKSPNSKNR